MAVELSSSDGTGYMQFQTQSVPERVDIRHMLHLPDGMRAPLREYTYDIQHTRAIANMIRKVQAHRADQQGKAYFALFRTGVASGNLSKAGVVGEQDSAIMRAIMLDTERLMGVCRDVMTFRGRLQSIRAHVIDHAAHIQFDMVSDACGSMTLSGQGVAAAVHDFRARWHDLREKYGKKPNLVRTGINAEEGHRSSLGEFVRKHEDTCDKELTALGSDLEYHYEAAANIYGYAIRQGQTATHEVLRS
jgi:hypothetical protein